MNLEQLDGFFAALICGPDLVRPSEYLPEIWGGGEMADEEAFSSRQQLKNFLDLVMRHWNAIAETLQSGDSKTHWSCQGVLLTAACCSPQPAALLLQMPHESGRRLTGCLAAAMEPLLGPCGSSTCCPQRTMVAISRRGELDAIRCPLVGSASGALTR